MYDNARFLQSSDRGSSDRGSSDRGNARLSTRAAIIRLRSSIPLFCSDLIALYTVVNTLIIAGMFVDLSLPETGALALSFALFPLAYVSFGLYEPVVLLPSAEISSFLKANFAVLIGFALPVLLVPSVHVALVLWLGLAAPLVVVLVPAYRILTRILFARASWWRQPVVVLSDDTRLGEEAYRLIDRHPEMGLRPACYVELEISDRSENQDHEHIFRRVWQRIAALEGRGVHLVVAFRSERAAVFFDRHLGEASFSGVYVARRDVSGFAVIEDSETGVSESGSAEALGQARPAARGAGTPFHNRPLSQRSIGRILSHYGRAWSDFLGRAAKRILDCAGAVSGMIVCAPILLAVACLVRCTSRGPIILRTQCRGQHGKRFSRITFRTGPAHPVEPFYSRFLGAQLRKYRIDRLPLLWNVIAGDMSFVGPRAYSQREIQGMRGLEHELLGYPPGIIGLTQASGRTTMSFDERVALDVRYTQTWSLALDFYIVLKSLPEYLNKRMAF